MSKNFFFIPEFLKLSTYVSSVTSYGHLGALLSVGGIAALTLSSGCKWLGREMQKSQDASNSENKKTIYKTIAMVAEIMGKILLVAGFLGIVAGTGLGLGALGFIVVGVTLKCGLLGACLAGIVTLPTGLFLGGLSAAKMVDRFNL